MSTQFIVSRAATNTPETRRGEGAKRREKRASKRLRVRLMTVGIGALLVAGATVAAWPKPLSVDEAVVRVDALDVTIDEPGRARVRERYAVTAPLGGDLARIELRAGDLVERGASLARVLPAPPGLLDPRSRLEATARVSASEAGAARALAEVTRAEAALRHAAEELATTQRLVDTGTVARDRLRHDELEVHLREQELAAAGFAAKVAAHETQLARAALLRHTDPGAPHDPFSVTSPVSGRVLRVLHESAGVVAPGTPLVEVGDPASLEIVVEVLTADAVRIAPAAPVRLERWGGPHPLAGHVRRVEPSAFTKLSALGVEEQRVNVVVDIDDPRSTWERLGDGYRVEAKVVTWHGDAVTVVPASALFRRGDDWAVFVDDHGRARLRTVRVGQRGLNDAQVTDGVAGGEHVVIHPSTAVTDGARIRDR